MDLSSTLKEVMNIIILFFISISGYSQDMPFILKEAPYQKLNLELFNFISETLHSNKPAPNLKCEVKVRTIQELRKFSTGTKWVDLLEVEYRNSRDYDGLPMKAYFPIGTEVSKQIITSEFSGTVEEIKLRVSDRLDHYFIFQHDGKGHIISMNMGNSLIMNPCILN
jgi:hypothetical protein